MLKNSLLTRPNLRNFLLYTGLFITVTGIFFIKSFKVLPNQGIVLLVLLALIQAFQRKIKLSDIFGSRLFTPFIFIFFIHIIGLIINRPENLKEIAHLVEKRAMYLALPFALIVLPPFPDKMYKNVILLFFILAIGTSAYCTYRYYINEEQIIISYQASGVLPTPVHHVIYSLMICYAIFCGIYLLPEKSLLLNSFKNFLILGGILYLIFFLHLLAVRSGLLSFYIILLTLILYTLSKRNYKTFFILSVCSMLLAFISFKYFKTIEAKWGYTLYDLEQAAQNKESYNNYSLARRIAANKIAFAVFKEHPVLGAGEEHLYQEMHAIYKKDFPFIREENYMAPHNQFLRILASQGLAGFIIIMVCFYFPLFYKKNYRLLPLLCIYILLTISFLFEDTLETQLGILFGLFFILLNLHSLKDKEATPAMASSPDSLPC